MKNSRNRKTYDFGDASYSPELIRKYENPSYAKKAEKYEREAKKRRANKHGGEPEPVYDDFESMIEAQYVGKSGKHGSGGKKKKYRINILTVLRNIIAVILILAVIGTGLFYFVTRDLRTETTHDYQFDMDEEAASNLRDYRNILILGSDARAGQPIESSRADAVIIMSINKKNGNVRLISVMRDSYLQMKYSDGTMILDKLAHSHAYGGGTDTASTLDRNLDLNIKEYIVFNWQAVSDTVNCLGGIEIDVKKNEINDLNRYGYETAANVGGTFREIKGPGRQTLDGIQATTYCRIRKTSGGDQGRTVRYRKVVSGVIKKALSHPWKLRGLSKKVFSNIRTNMDRTRMLTALLRSPFFDIKEGMTWPENYYSGYLSNGVSYVVPNTLSSNVKTLHEKAFGQKGYSVSPKCEEISGIIGRDSGIY